MPLQIQVLELQPHMLWSFLLLSELRGELIDLFVDIGGIVDYSGIYRVDSLEIGLVST